MKRVFTLLSLAALLASFQPLAFSQNQALAMDDVDDYVELSQWASSLIFDAPATVEFWFKANFDHRAPQNEQYYSSVFDIHDGGAPAMNDRGFTIWYGSATGAWSNEILFAAHREIPDQFSYRGLTGNDDHTGQWHHYSIVCTGSSYIIYRGGELLSSQTAGNTSSFQGDFGENILPKVFAAIGKFQANEGWLNGTLDEFRLWNTACTAAEIAANYNATLCAPQAGLVAYYKFDQ